MNKINKDIAGSDLVLKSKNIVKYALDWQKIDFSRGATFEMKPFPPLPNTVLLGHVPACIHFHGQQAANHGKPCRALENCF